MRKSILIILCLLVSNCLHLKAQDWDVDQALMRFTYEDTPGPPPAGPLIGRWEVGIGNNFTDPKFFTIGHYRFNLDYIIKENALVARHDNLYVGIGQDDPKARLHIYNLSQGSQEIPAVQLGTYSNVANGYLLVNKPNSDNNSTIARFRDNGATMVEINENHKDYQLRVYGDIGASNLFMVSDGNYKKDVRPIDNGLDFIDQLRPKSYQFREPQTNSVPDGKRSYGLIAQELQKIAPELVKEATIYNEVTERYESQLSVSYIGLIPFLIAANQELHKEVENLKLEVAALKN